MCQLHAPVHACTDVWGSSLCSYTSLLCARTDSCSGKTLDGSCYELVKKELSWSDARAYCSDRGGHLADILSKKENDVIKDMIGGK